MVRDTVSKISHLFLPNETCLFCPSKIFHFIYTSFVSIDYFYTHAM